MSEKKDPAPAERGDDGVIEAAGVLVGREGDVISRYLRPESSDVLADKGATHQAIIDEIMSSESADDVLDLPDAEDLEDYNNRPITITGFTVQDSEFEQGAPVYFTVKAVELSTGRRVIINTGEQAVMAQLLRLEAFGAFPVDVVPSQAKRMNQYNRFPMRLKKSEG